MAERTVPLLRRLGLSCLITTRTPSSQHTLLFDTGPDESIFERNVIRLVDMGGVDATMLSQHSQRACPGGERG